MNGYLKFSWWAFLGAVIVGPSQAFAIELQSNNWNLNLFGYVAGRVASPEDRNGEDIALGETSVFVFGRLSDRVSVLTEVTVLPKKYRQDTVKVERLRLRFDFSEKHWLSLGKMHTPVNYWNDSYHHGRYFFPTIERPQVFKQFVPIHDIGLRFSGSRLGKYGFFYDIVLGSGQSAGNKAFANGLQSMTVAVGVRPIKNLEIRTSYYKDTIINHWSSPDHAGLQPRENSDLDYALWSGSIHYENNRFKALGEFSGSRTVSTKKNWASYLYLGWKWRPRVVPYYFFDYLNVDPEEQHYSVGIQRRYGVGLEYLISERLNLKVELTHNDSTKDGTAQSDADIRFQLSVSI